MKAIRSLIMSRKVQRSITRCTQCSHFTQTGDLPPLPLLVPCHRICMLIKGRFYYRWFCQQCIERIWGIVPGLCEEQTQVGEQEEEHSTTHIDQPFGRGQGIGYALVKHGILDHLDLTNVQECHKMARCYAECAYPTACVEDQRVLMAGILHAWMNAHDKYREEMR